MMNQARPYDPDLDVADERRLRRSIGGASETNPDKHGSWFLCETKEFCRG